MARAQHHESDHRDLLRRAGLRITAVRLRILHALCAKHRAMSADEILELVSKSKRSGKPDRVTVYRTLNALVDAGIAHRVDPGDRVFRFGLTGEHAEHSAAAPGAKDRHTVNARAREGELSGAQEKDHEHPHFVCDSCGQVRCLEGAEVVVKTKAPPPRPTTHPGVGSGAPARGKGAKLRIKQRQVLLHGTCEECDEGSDGR